MNIIMTITKTVPTANRTTKMVNSSTLPPGPLSIYARSGASVEKILTGTELVPIN